MDVIPILKVPALAGNLTTHYTTGSDASQPETELPARQVVAAPGSVDHVAASDKQAEPLPERMERGVIIDPTTHELVFQAIDSRTREVVDQLPDKTILGLRTYIQGIADKASASRALGDGVRKATAVTA